MHFQSFDFQIKFKLKVEIKGLHQNEFLDFHNLPGYFNNLPEFCHYLTGYFHNLPGYFNNLPEYCHNSPGYFHDLPGYFQDLPGYCHDLPRYCQI